MFGEGINLGNINYLRAKRGLPQNKLSDLGVAIDLLKSGCFEGLDLLYDSVPDVLSQLVRTAFVPREEAIDIIVRIIEKRNRGKTF